MASILKVDTIQDQSGNNIINENADTITIGASGDTVNIIGTLQNNGAGVGGVNTPFFIARKNSDQIISDAAETKLTFEATDTESSSGVFDLTNNKFTVTEAGKYNISINVYHYDPTNDILRSDGFIYKNGSPYAQWINDRTQDTNERGLQVGGSIIMNLSVNDYIEAYARSDTSDGGSTNIEGSSSLLLTYLSGFKIIE